MIASAGAWVSIAACAPGGLATRTNADVTNTGIDSLNARLVDAYRRRDPAAYAALFTDTALFEWPAFNTVRGPAALAAMARDNWAAEREGDLRLNVASRRNGGEHATRV